MEQFKRSSVLVVILAIALFVSGCAPMLIAGGAAGGYAVAKHNDGK